MTNAIKIEIEVRDRLSGSKDRFGKTRVYFFHEDENMLEGFGNRVARPRDLYKTYLPQIAEAMGVDRTTKFSWSQKAGCRCGCSPGFICDVRGKDVFVHLTDAPKTNDNPEELALAQNRLGQLVGRLEAEVLLKAQPPVDVVWC